MWIDLMRKLVIFVMKIALVQILCPAGVFASTLWCRPAYQSYTVTHVSARDLAGASVSGGQKLPPGKGIFAVEGKKRGRMIIESAPIMALFPFDHAVISGSADLPPDSYISYELSAGFTGEKGELVWSDWYKLGIFRPDGASASAGAQEDAFGRVETDTLSLKTRAKALRYRVSLEGPGGETALRLVAVNYNDASKPYDETVALDRLPKPATGTAPWVRRLDVPQRSQMEEQERYRHDICSPTSLSMVLDFRGLKLATMQTVAAVYDGAAEIYGNWIFNTAFAGSRGFDSFVDRLSSVAEVEHEIANGRPVIASITFGHGELKNAPIKQTKGHLVVITGFDKNGNFLVNDPAANASAAVNRVYNREEFARVWLKNKNGLIYRVAPRLPKVMRVAVPLANLYSEPLDVAASTAAPVLESQLLLGELVQVSEFKGEWARVECVEQAYYPDKKGPRQAALERPDKWGGYPGWVKADTLAYGDMYAGGYVITAASTTAQVETAQGIVPLTLYMGTRLCPVADEDGGSVKVVLPDGRPALVSTKDAEPAVRKSGVRSGVLEQARKYINVPYILGGRTAEGIDCSGLSGIAYRSMGIYLPRNAYEQYLYAKHLKKVNLEKGDLVFTSGRNRPRDIVHVMLYAGGEKLLESTQEAGKMRETTFKEKLGVPLSKITEGQPVGERMVYFGTVLDD